MKYTFERSAAVYIFSFSSPEGTSEEAAGGHNKGFFYSDGKLSTALPVHRGLCSNIRVVSVALHRD